MDWTSAKTKGYCYKQQWYYPPKPARECIVDSSGTLRNLMINYNLSINDLLDAEIVSEYSYFELKVPNYNYEAEMAEFEKTFWKHFDEYVDEQRQLQK